MTLQIVEWGLLIVVGIYILQALLLLWGTFQHQKSKHQQNAPQVSIIVAARNEQQTLQRTIESLLQLDYPQDKLEILLVDDRSEDSTREIIQRFAQKYSFIKLIPIRAMIPGLSGKQTAIHTAVQNARGEYILLTDADCQVPFSWVKEIIAYYDERTGMVCGQTELISQAQKLSLWEGIQAIDWFYLLTAASGACGIGKPTSCIGNNLSFRKSVYQQIGGFPKIGFSVTEDFALLDAVVRQTTWQVRFPISSKMTVQSHPVPTVKNLIAQRKRWLIGGKKVRPYGKLLMSTSFFTHLLIPLTLILTNKLLLVTISFGTVVMADFMLILRSIIPLHRSSLLRFFPLFEIAYFLYTTFLAGFIFSKRIHWKGIVYEHK